MFVTTRQAATALCTLCVAAAAGCVELRTPDPNVIYVAFGDSTTDGPSSRDYPEILRELLNMAPVTFANEGESGEKTDEGLDRLMRLLDAEIFPNAEVLLYWEGGNEITDFIANNDPLLTLTPTDPSYPFASRLNNRLDAVQENIEAAITAAQAVGLDVYVATYFDIRETASTCPSLPFELLFPGQASNANQYVALLNDRIRAAADARGAVLVDVAALNTQITADPTNYENCSHLSAAGNALVAGLFFEEISARRD